MRAKTAMRLVMVVAGMCLVDPASSEAQRRPGGSRGPDLSRELNSGEYWFPPDWRGNPVYDGRVTFVRIKYRGYKHWTNQGPGWAHDYPIAESHFAKIMKEITTMRPFVEAAPIYGSAVLAFDDPQLMKYPIAWMSEPDGWQMNDTELAGFKKYISRGGFIIFDDMGTGDRRFGGGDSQLPNLIFEWQRAFPKAKLMEIPPTHPVFDSFFKIDFAKVEGWYGRPEFYGFFEDNDPKKRLMAVVNNNNDLGEYMEYSDRGFNVTPSNEAYKLAVNYFVYALTH